MNSGGSTFQVLSLDGDVVKHYKRPKFHRKTKSGCLECKIKKVKCDESRPICKRCQRNSRLCSYGPDKTHSATKDSPLPKDCGSSSILSAFALVPASVQDISKYGTPIFHLIQHFHTHWVEILHIPLNQKVLSISRTSPLLANTMFVLAACHLRHVSPGVLQHRIAEHYQQSVVLRDMQSVLDTPRDQLEQSSVDALILSAMLLNMAAFTLPNYESTLWTEPKTSWVFNRRDDRLGWLALQVGLRPLLLSMAAYLENTLKFLSPIFFGGQFRRVSHDLRNVPQGWIEFFDLEDSGYGCDSKDASDIFRAPVSVLIQLRDLEPVPSSLYKNLQFLGKVQQEFRALLLRRDEKALWLFGYWLGIMCRYKDVWWCARRSRRDYTAICMWLQHCHVMERPGIEGKMWRQMMVELEAAPVWISGN